MTDKISGRHGNGVPNNFGKKTVPFPDYPNSSPGPRDADPWMKTFFDNKSRQLFLKIFNTKIFEFNESRYD